MGAAGPVIYGSLVQSQQFVVERLGFRDPGLQDINVPGRVLAHFVLVVVERAADHPAVILARRKPVEVRKRVAEFLQRLPGGRTDEFACRLPDGFAGIIGVGVPLEIGRNRVGYTPHWEVAVEAVPADGFKEPVPVQVLQGVYGLGAIVVEICPVPCDGAVLPEPRLAPDQAGDPFHLIPGGKRRAVHTLAGPEDIRLHGPSVADRPEIGIAVLAVRPPARPARAPVERGTDQEPRPGIVLFQARHEVGDNPGVCFASASEFLLVVRVERKANVVELDVEMAAGRLHSPGVNEQRAQAFLVRAYLVFRGADLRMHASVPGDSQRGKASANVIYDRQPAARAVPFFRHAPVAVARVLPVPVPGGNDLLVHVCVELAHHREAPFLGQKESGVGHVGIAGPGPPRQPGG